MPAVSATAVHEVSAVPFRSKDTVPDGVPDPGADAVTAAVTVTAWPTATEVNVPNDGYFDDRSPGQRLPHLAGPADSATGHAVPDDPDL